MGARERRGRWVGQYAPLGPGGKGRTLALRRIRRIGQHEPFGPGGGGRAPALLDLAVMKACMRFAIEEMRSEHIPAISAIDRAVYPIPWPIHSYRSELHNRSAYYVVACRVDADAHVDHPAEVGAGTV